jgi:NAD(P)-dependent dehydrogenase (short-subunit alcohol dehydrogenase family)
MQIDRETPMSTLMKSLEQHVMLVTGATDGLGKQLAHELAAAGATVLLHGRLPARGEAVLREISEATGNDRLAFYLADFASLAQIRRLANEILADHDRLDVLVNNAGIGFGRRDAPEREVSQDGFELRFAVNYLAPFLLTQLLQPLLVGSAPVRIVNVASAGQAPIDFDDVMLERAYDGVRAYRQSKLALVMFTFDLADELRDAGVTANCLHPATFMPTKMVLEAGVNPVSSLEQGLQATLRLVADADLDGVTGRYFDGRREARAHPQAYDLDARRRLRELSTQLVGLPTEAMREATTTSIPAPARPCTGG